MAATKKCSKCGETKATSEFHKYKQKRDYLKSNCKVCDQTRRNATHKKVEAHRAKLKREAGRCFECKMATITLDFAHWPATA